MARRQTKTMQGERFLGNVSARQVHDLDHETPQCHIDDIIENEHERPFRSLDEAREAGFDTCNDCIGGSAERDGVGL